MKTKLLYYSDLLRTSFWFLPSMMVVGSIVLALGMIQLDQRMPGRADAEWFLVYNGGAEGARSVLSTIAGSMITVAGVVFSITIVALTLASSQFGPRLLRNFIRDRSNQFVLGTFIAAYLYCLLVLRTIRGGDENGFVPGISVIVGVLLAVAGLAVLIYFIHHVAIAIQADTVVMHVSHELHRTIDRLFPEELGKSIDRDRPQNDACLPDFDRQAATVHIAESGYIVAIDSEQLLGAAGTHQVVLKLLCRPGHFMILGDPLCKVVPEAAASEELESEIREAVQLGSERTALQDVEFCVDQLVEVAVRALSPGVNDPFTAITCIDRLGSALCRIVEREIPSPYRHDDDKRLRVIAYPVTPGNLLDAAFNQIRQYGGSSPAILIRLLENLRAIALRTTRDEDLEAVARHAESVLHAAKGITDPGDCKAIHERYESTLAALGRDGETPAAAVMLCAKD